MFSGLGNLVRTRQAFCASTAFSSWGFATSIFAALIFATEVFIAISTVHSVSFAQTTIRPPNYDETMVPRYELPSVLVGKDGKVIASADQWPEHRNYLLSLLADNEYGSMPKESVGIDVEKLDDGPAIHQGKEEPGIRRRQFAVTLSQNGKVVRIDLLLWTPKESTQLVNCFVGLNFRGNQSTTDDPKVRLTSSWCDARNPGVVNNRATEASRASQGERWPIREIVGAGYGVATAHYGDIDPDFDDGFENGVHALFPEYRCTEKTPERWGSISAWAWGLSRIADVLTKTEGIHPEGMMVLGHSRLGKTALWAGANDERFKIVISNNSGCGGAALSKRCFGESVARINTSFPHWFNRNFRRYNDQEEKMPFDQHQLVAAIAPRPVYIASASKDLWADPQGELLSGHQANPAYALFGLNGGLPNQLPAVNQSIGEAVGYHLREGEHDLTPSDWMYFIQFARKHGL